MCPNCKTEIQDARQNYCTTCGEDLRTLHTVCASCGHGVHESVIENSLNYCIECGAEWKNAIPPAAA